MVVPLSSAVDNFLVCDVSPSLASLPSPFSTSAVCCFSRRNLYGIQRERNHLYFPVYKGDLQNIFTYEGEDTIKAGYSLDLDQVSKVQMHRGARGVLGKRLSREKLNLFIFLYKFIKFRFFFSGRLNLRCILKLTRGKANLIIIA